MGEIPRAGLEWQEWRASNPQPPVLETGALPIELHSCMRRRVFRPATGCRHDTHRRESLGARPSAVPAPFHSMMSVTTPAPTVRPPSRMAKRRPSSMAIGAIRFTVIVTLSPGITISTSSGSSIDPVTSVVRK